MRPLADSRSYPFQAGDGSRVSEREWGDMAADWASTGVRAPSALYDTNPLRVTRRDGASVTVSPGRAKITGHHYWLRSEAAVSIPPFTASGRERIDFVALTLDMTAPTEPGSHIELRVRTGSEAAPGRAVDPPHPMLWDSSTATPGLWDLPLSRVTSSAGDPVYDGSTIVGYRPVIQSVADVRRYTAPGGLAVAASTETLPWRPSDGQLAWRTDRRTLDVYDQAGARWATLSQVGATTSYTPRVTGLSAGYTAVGRYALLADKVAYVSIQINVSRRVTPNGDSVRIYLPFTPRAGMNNPMTVHQYSGNDSNVNMTVGNALVRAGGYVEIYAPNMTKTSIDKWDLDRMRRDAAGTCILNHAGGSMSFMGVYDLK